MLVITRVRMLHFTKQYKDTLQMRLTILMPVCSKFITVYYIQIKKDMIKLLLKQNGAVFYASQCITCSILLLIHNYTSDNMLSTLFMTQCSAVDLLYHLFDVHVG